MLEKQTTNQSFYPQASIADKDNFTPIQWAQRLGKMRILVMLEGWQPEDHVEEEAVEVEEGARLLRGAVDYEYLG